MARVKIRTVLLFYIFVFIKLINGETYNVKIGADYVNIVDKNFLSFTIDPKHLFTTVETFNNKQNVCMASFLSPAYLQIAGPSTSHMTFKNTTITIDKFDKDHKETSLLSNLFVKHKKRDISKRIEISETQWREFVEWANTTGFEIVFALNNEKKSASGLWDANEAMNVMSMAKRAKIERIYWQLGQECNHQTIDDYLNDLETLRVIVESFSSEPGLKGWKVAGADVTKCLRESKSDFKDFITLSIDMVDAVMLNGNSTSQELSKMADDERLNLLTMLYHSGIPRWVSERSGHTQKFFRAALWAADLGYSARNGFSVQFMELLEDELYEPTLSFYMAFLFKNLVGERVLPVDFDGAETTLFAHCTSLRRKPVPSAVTLFGVNVDDEPARFSLKLSKREEGGEIMQFILKEDEDGNIIVNGRVMSNEGDIRPTVKRVRPYKTLIINLPSKSFGFWVLANTKIEACLNTEEPKKMVKAEDVYDIETDSELKTRRKRYANTIDFDNEDNTINSHSKGLKFFDDRNIIDNEMNELNNDLMKINKIFNKRAVKKTKRQLQEDRSKKFRRQLFKTNKENSRPRVFENKPLLNLIDSFMQITRNNVTNFADKIRKFSLRKNMIGRRNFKNVKDDFEIKGNNKRVRVRRSVDDAEEYENTDDRKENEIDKSMNNKQLWRAINNIQNQLKKMSVHIPNRFKNDDMDEKIERDDKLELNTEVSEENEMKFREKPSHGAIRSALDNVVSVVSDLNRNLNKFWEAIPFLSD